MTFTEWLYNRDQEYVEKLLAEAGIFRQLRKGGKVVSDTSSVLTLLGRMMRAGAFGASLMAQHPYVPDQPEPPAKTQTFVPTLIKKIKGMDTPLSRGIEDAENFYPDEEERKRKDWLAAAILNTQHPAYIKYTPPGLRKKGN